LIGPPARRQVESHLDRLRQKIEADPARARIVVIVVTEISGYRRRP